MEKINLITPEDMATFDRIDRDCMKMHVCPPPKTFINMKVHDAGGKLTLDMDMPSRSWVRNAYNMMAHLFLDLNYSTGGTSYGEGALRSKQYDGTITSSASYRMRPFDALNTYRSIAGIDTQGIVIGTGTDAENFESHRLSGHIEHGDSAGKMNYTLHTNSGGTYDSGSKKWSNVLSRVFNNNSGGSIIIGEVGIIGMLFISSSGGSFLLSRDLLSSPVTVASAAQLTVTYTIEMTFPA